MKKVLLGFTLMLFSAVQSFSQDIASTDYLLYNNDFLTTQVTFTGASLVYNGITAVNASQVGCMSIATNSNEYINYSSQLLNSNQTLNLTITGPGVIIISYVRCGVGISVMQNHVLKVVDGSFAFTQKVQNVVTLTGTDLVYNLTATSSISDPISYNVTDLALSEFRIGSSAKIGPIDGGGKDVPKPAFSLSGSLLTISGTGSFRVVATQRTIEYSYDFTVVTGTGINNTSSSGANTSTPGSNVSTPGQTFSQSIITFPTSGTAQISKSSNILSWNVVSGATSYCIRLSKDQNFADGTVTVCGLTGASYAVNATAPGMTARTEVVSAETWYYQVRALNGNNEATAWSATQSFNAVDAGVTGTTLVTGGLSVAFSISPNPSSGLFQILTTADLSTTPISIFDALGAEVAFQLNENQLTIAKSGIYFIKIGVSSAKIVVE